MATTGCCSCRRSSKQDRKFTAGDVRLGQGRRSERGRAGETEFARDATFGCRRFRLPPRLRRREKWREDSSRAKSSASPSRRHPTWRAADEVTEILTDVNGGAFVVVQRRRSMPTSTWSCWVCSTRRRPERRSLYRVGPSFPQPLAGLDPQPPLQASDIWPGGRPGVTAWLLAGVARRPNQPPGSGSARDAAASSRVELGCPPSHRPQPGATATSPTPRQASSPPSNTPTCCCTHQSNVASRRRPRDEAWRSAAGRLSHGLDRGRPRGAVCPQQTGLVRQPGAASRRTTWRYAASESVARSCKRPAHCQASSPAIPARQEAAPEGSSGRLMSFPRATSVTKQTLAYVIDPLSSAAGRDAFARGPAVVLDARACRPGDTALHRPHRRSPSGRYAGAAGTGPACRSFCKPVPAPIVRRHVRCSRPRRWPPLVTRLCRSGVHLDHSTDLEEIRDCLALGYTSRDGRRFAPNVRGKCGTHPCGRSPSPRRRGVGVEAELGALAGDEDASTGVASGSSPIQRRRRSSWTAPAWMSSPRRWAPYMASQHRRSMSTCERGRDDRRNRPAFPRRCMAHRVCQRRPPQPP